MPNPTGKRGRPISIPRMWQSNEKVQAAASVRFRGRQRAAMLAAYGGKCECCGESSPQFLGIDHVNGGGTQHRKEVGSDMAKWLKDRGWPSDGFRLLCHNCNLAKGFYGFCHVVLVEETA